MVGRAIGAAALSRMCVLQYGYKDVVERLLARPDIEVRVLLSPGRRLRAEHTMHARMHDAVRRMHVHVLLV